MNVQDCINPAEEALNISSLQKKWRSSFVDLSLWDIVQTGEGMTLDNTAVPGELKISSGVTNGDTIIRSKERFTVPFRAVFGHTLSQRIAGQEFWLDIISVDPVTGEPNGLHSASFCFDGTSATSNKYAVQNGGLASLVSGGTTFTTTASYSVYEIELFVDECWFHSRAMDSAAARGYSNVRHQQIPDPNATYKVQIRARNTASPASSTDWKFQFVTVVDYIELTAEITAGRGNMAAGQGIFATMTGSVAGTTAHGSSGTSVYPVKIGGRAVNANITAVSSGYMCDFIATLVGAQIIKPYSIPEGDWQYACSAPITNTTDVALKAAGASGIRNYVTALQYQNINSTATEVVVKDGSTVIWRGYAPANMTQPAIIAFPTPLKGTAATAMNFACITTSASVYVDAQGYQAP